MEFVPLPDAGRRFVASRKVRLGDASPKGRLRLDAIARYLQDVANDDASNADLSNALYWVVRRSLVEVDVPIELGETVELTTFCSGTGQRWAERRTVLRGDAGGHVEAAVLWVHVDPDTAMPKRLGEEFLEIYGSSTAGRRVRARLQLPDPSGNAAGEPWAFRFVDYDVLGHVNNAAYWGVVEEHVAGSGGRLRAELEYRAAIDPNDAVTLVASESDGVGLMWFKVGDDVRASARVVSLT